MIYNELTMIIEKNSSWVWLLMCLIFLAIELFSDEIFFIWFSISTFITHVCSLFIYNIEIQIVVFIICSLILLIFIKSILDKFIEFNVKFKKNDFLKFNKGIVIKVEDSVNKSYKILTRNGIYLAQGVKSERKIRKYNVCKIIKREGDSIFIS